jgi:hypothetical protein
MYNLQISSQLKKKGFSEPMSDMYKSAGLSLLSN